MTSVPLQRQTSEIFNARHSSTIPAPSTLVWGGVWGDVGRVVSLQNAGAVNAGMAEGSSREYFA